jgi:colicin import membrane protein
MKCEITEYSATTAALAKLKTELAGKQYDCTNATGMALARFDRRGLVSLRTDLDRKRKEIKAPALERCKLIDSEAKRIETELLSLENPIDEQIKAQEAVEEAKRQEKARLAAEAQRILDEKIAAIAKIPLSQIGKESHEISTFLAALEARPFGPEYSEETLARAESAKAESVTAIREMLAATLRAEEQAALAKAEQEAETARLAEEKRVADIADKIDKIRAIERAARKFTIADLEDAISTLEQLAVGDIEFQEFRAEAQDAKISALQTLTDTRQEKREAARLLAEQQAQLAAAQKKLDDEKAAFEAEQAEARKAQEAIDLAAKEKREAEEAEQRRIADEAAAKQRELDRLAAIELANAAKEAEKNRKATSALKKILAICQDPEAGTTYKVEQIEIIAEANI